MKNLAFQRYIYENEAVLNLNRHDLNAPEEKIRMDKPWRIFLKLNLDILRCMKTYSKELVTGINFLNHTKNLKNSKLSSRAVVIGNGPSAGILTKDLLDQFCRNGGETICVNYWQLNEDLRAHTPTWMVFSDPATFKNRLGPEKSKSLIKYLQDNPQIKLVMPVGMLNNFDEFDISNQRFGFSDSYFPVGNFISPVLPRGYTSMTLYKALAWAVHLGYSQIGIIGMDNTYPRDIFCDQNNKLIVREVHAGMADYIVDHSAPFPSIAHYLQNLFILFRDLECFPRNCAVNLDLYSLTDRFKKVKPSHFFGELSRLGD